MSATASGLVQALHASGPAKDRAGKMGLYAWLIGDWEMDTTTFTETGTTIAGRGEIHFGWVLEGRAIQDVWITPPRGGAEGAPGAVRFYGTTLRMYDPGLDAWHIIWIDPVKAYVSRQIGRAEDGEIVQLGRDDSGRKTRWRFTDIAHDRFHWTGEVSPDEGVTWRCVVAFTARRIISHQAREAA